MDEKEEEAAKAKPAAPAPAAVVAAATEAVGTAGNKEEKLRLPQKFVDYVLSWKPEVSVDPDEYYARRINDPFFSREYVERSTQTFRDVAEMTKRCAEMMVEYKSWMRAQYEEKGYVEVDDDYIAEGVRWSQEMEEEEDEYPEAFGPMEGLISDDTPQSVIDEIEGRVSAEST